MTDMFPRTLPADPYHGGVRFTALGVWFGAIVVAYLILRWLADLIVGGVAGIGVMLLVILAVLAAQPLAYLAERWLVRRWPSGRELHLEPSALTWRTREATIRFDLGQTLNYWRWRFVIKRRRGGRIASGHHLFAVRLVQGEAEVSVYTFLPPAAADALDIRIAFYELRSSAATGKAALGGRDAVYLAAEEARWASGAELNPVDFEAFLSHLATNATDFASNPASTLHS